MRKFVFMLLVGGALLAVGPAAALARSNGRSHHHARHHARVRFERFGSSDVSQQGMSTGQSSTTGSPADQNANRVSSFMNGVLTIALSDGSVVSGKVTSDTEIKCEAPESTSTTTHHEGDGGSQSGGGNNGDNATNGDDHGADQGQQKCMNALQSNTTIVREAELRVSSTGAIWDKVDLVSQQATAGNNDNDNDNENEANDNSDS